MKLTSIIVGLIILISVQVSAAQDISIVNVKFTGPVQPKNKIDQGQTYYRKHFSTSSSYTMEVELIADIPANTSFNVGTYAIVGGRRILLGDARVGKAAPANRIYATYDIFPSSANFNGRCQFVVVADSNKEVYETNEMNNEWKFPVTIHPPGVNF